MLAGDFNLVRSANDKNNNNNVSTSLMSAFNDAIHSLGVQELELINKKYTWTNGQLVSVLARLDRVFVNNELKLAYGCPHPSRLPRMLLSLPCLFQKKACPVRNSTVTP